MKRKTALTLSIVAALTLGGGVTAALAHGSFGGQGSRAGMMAGQMGGQMGGRQGGPMGGQDGQMRGRMMQMMQMMKGHGQGGMMGGMRGGAMGYMHKLLDTNGDGNITPEEARAALEGLLAEYDANGDGTLSIDEFETLHSAVIRESMVDRFQMLDADGDGKVTAEELTAPVDKMERFMGQRGAMMGGQGRMMGGHGAGQGGMMTPDQDADENN